MRQKVTFLDTVQCRQQTYVECCVKAYKVWEIGIPFFSDEFEDIFFTINVFSLLLPHDLTLVADLKKFTLSHLHSTPIFNFTLIATSFSDLTSLAKKTDEKLPSPMSLPKM